ncbi:MAG: 23S rRNA (guanosine(2251)-2'-O)-methyltransferase RlmB [Eubacteriales bacterium]|nr:23S rRNA (guanosine(2251)-2'-O)-methyltransferase RlmB [Eubacteriales bacterium]
MDNNIENLIEGKNAILEALKANKSVKKLFVLKDTKDSKINDIINKAKEQNAIIIFQNKKELDLLSNCGKHQGVIAQIEEYSYVSVDDIINYALSKNEKPFIIILDEIIDPHNLGAIIRTANLCGAHGIILKNRNQVPITSIVINASAGAIYHTKIAKVINLSNTIDDLKKKGLWFVCSDISGENMYNIDMKGAIGLVVGNEGEGVSRLVREKCDYVIKIPMYGNIDSLNVSVSTGIIAYEIVRQNKFL